MNLHNKYDIYIEFQGHDIFQCYIFLIIFRKFYQMGFSMLYHLDNS